MASFIKVTPAFPVSPVWVNIDHITTFEDGRITTVDGWRTDVKETAGQIAEKILDLVAGSQS